MKFICIPFIFISSIFWSQKEYFPIECGKEWKYEYTEEMKLLMGDVSITCGISDIKTRLSGNVYFVMTFSYSDEAFGQPYEVYYRYIEDKGWYSYNTEMEKEELVFPAKAKVGTTWTEDHYKMEVTSLNERIDTPGMNYPSCIVIKTTSTEVENPIPSYTYYVEGIGSVGIITNDKLVNYLKK